MNLPEEKRDVLLKLLSAMHTKPQPHTYAWWNSLCPADCYACAAVKILNGEA